MTEERRLPLLRDGRVTRVKLDAIDRISECEFLLLLARYWVLGQWDRVELAAARPEAS